MEYAPKQQLLYQNHLRIIYTDDVFFLYMAWHFVLLCLTVYNHVIFDLFDAVQVHLCTGVVENLSHLENSSHLYILLM